MTVERQRPESFATGPDSFSDEFAPVAVAEGRVEVIHGVYAHNLPLAGMTVAQARGELADRMNIDPDAMAVVDGNHVPEDTVLNEGNTLNFVKLAGEKGMAVAESLRDSEISRCCQTQSKHKGVGHLFRQTG